MKKYFSCLLLALCFFIPATANAQADKIEHADQKVNFRLQTYAAWDKLTITDNPLDKNPGWVVRLSRSEPAGKNAVLALMVVDGRKSKDFQQATKDFENDQAKIILEQIVFSEREQYAKENYQISNYEVKRVGKNNYILITLDNKQENATILRAMTFKNNYSYSLATRITGNYSQEERRTITDNFQLVLNTLTPFK